MLLQALGGDDVAPDLADVQAEDGDRVMLCSDGLSGVVAAGVIADVLRTETDPQAAADRLVELAVEGGGPDNVTCVVADVRATTHDPGDDDTTEAHLVGAAAIGAAHPDALRYDDEPADDAEPSDPDSPDHESKDVDESEVARYAPRRRGRARVVLAAVTAVVVLAALVVGFRAVSAWYDAQYFVGVDGDSVVIRQGVPGIPGSAVVTEIDDLPVASLPDFYQEEVNDGIRADDLADASAIAERVRREACRANNAGPQISGFPGLDCSSADGVASS